MHLAMCSKFAKVQPDGVKLHNTMMTAFAYRRQQIVKDPQRVCVLMSDWPALFPQSEVCHTFWLRVKLNAVSTCLPDILNFDLIKTTSPIETKICTTD